MRGWHRPLRRRLVAAQLKWKTPAGTRSFVTRSHERVEVRCGSSGHVAVDLFNLSAHPPDTNLVVYFPAFPSSESATTAHPPAFLQNWPVACINYRWEQAKLGLNTPDNLVLPAQWPTPVHDTAFAYSWLLDNLAPPGLGRRDIYAYGSFLGAGLATSLALTESHTHATFGVRGVVAYNGVYNWTMFLPEHPIHKRKGTKTLDALISGPLAEGLHLEELQDAMPDLFKEPTNLFDPFASPSLFFHNPGLHVPRTFTATSSPLSDMVSLMTGEEASEAPAAPPKPPRKSHLVFPPRASTLKIPQTLLLYDHQPAKPSRGKRASTRRRGHTFRTQAEELAGLMRRSIEKVELKERGKWDEDIHVWEEEAERRVQVAEVGEERGDFALGMAGQERVLNWLEDRS